MWQTKLNSDNFHTIGFPMLAAVVAFAALICATSMAQQPGQKTFSSAEEASNALIAAARGNDEKALLDILGPDGKQIISSGDNTEDAESRATFVEKYQEMHRLVQEPDGTTTLYIGAENWPTPIPILNRGNSWYFDTLTGKQEVLFRRIGRNEMSTIRVCEELVAAQKEYYSTHQNQYAQKIFSDEGKQDGLYWKAPDGGSSSPVGPLVASAANSYAKSQDQGPTPFRGYYFRTLTRQGKKGPGGAKDYVVDGKMIQGFAFVAYPAEYRSSGVMTFIVDQDGIVYQKDLGKKTEVLAKSLKEYNPDSSWQKNENQQEDAAEGENTK
jgi:Protein of unknown function (DUF2950)